MANQQGDGIISEYQDEVTDPNSFRWPVEGGGAIAILGEDVHDSLQLRCNRHPGSICHDIDQLLELGFDAEQVWAGPPFIKVPLFSDPDIWATVQLQIPEHMPEFRKASLVYPTSIYTSRNVPSYEYLSMLSPGDGRKVIRDLIAIHMQRRYLEIQAAGGVTFPKCNSTGHGFTAERTLQQIRAVKNDGKKKPSEFWANFWTLQTLGACVECSFFNPDSDVPADDDFGRFPRRR